MPTDVNGVGVHVDVHEVVHYFTLDVILHPVHQETTADVDDLDERQVPERGNQKRSQSCKHDRYVTVGYLVPLVSSKTHRSEL